MSRLYAYQNEVLALMGEGWELGRNMTSFHSHSWLQQGGCGRGGPSKEVHGNTVNALLRKGLIKTKERVFPLETFQLTTGETNE